MLFHVALSHTFACTHIYARLKRGSMHLLQIQAALHNKRYNLLLRSKGKKGSAKVVSESACVCVGGGSEWCSDLMLSVGRYCEPSPQQEHRWWWHCGCAWAPECQVALLHSSSSERMTSIPLMISENPASLLHKYTFTQAYNLHNTFMQKIA